MSSGSSFHSMEEHSASGYSENTSSSGCTTPTLNPKLEDDDKCLYALPQSLLHSPSEDEDMLDVNPEEDLVKVSKRLQDFSMENEEKALISKFLYMAKNSNIKVEIPNSATFATNNENQTPIGTRPSGTVPSESKAPRESFISSVNTNFVPRAESLKPSHSSSQLDKYNVHAFPFIPQSVPLPVLPRILKISNLDLSFEAGSFVQFCKNYGEMMMCEFDRGTGYVAYFNNNQAELAQKEMTEFFNLNFAGTMVERINALEHTPIPNIQNAMNLCSYDTIQIEFTHLVSQNHWTAVSSQVSRLGQIESMRNVFLGGRKAMVYSFYDIRGAFASFQHFTSVGFIEGAELTITFVDSIILQEKSITGDVLASFTAFAPSYIYPPAHNRPHRRASSNFPFSGIPLMSKGDTLDDFLKNGSLDMNKERFGPHYQINSYGQWNREHEDFGELNVVTKANVSKNNVIDLRRISRGLDTRTTVMLRNIPNKVDQKMLKDYLDVTNKHTYDFLYLRIDFANKCNVGYAFVSFISPEHIITFARARAGTKWNRFNSEKICDLSYANIYAKKHFPFADFKLKMCITQGKECLIEKFRNSSVMDQNPAYRPLIFFSDSELIGQYQEFPPPNNMNRKLRSIANIERIGLFSPQSTGPRVQPGPFSGPLIGPSSVLSSLDINQEKFQHRHHSPSNSVQVNNEFGGGDDKYHNENSQQKQHNNQFQYQKMSQEHENIGSTSFQQPSHHQFNLIDVPGAPRAFMVPPSTDGY